MSSPGSLYADLEGSGLQDQGSPQWLSSEADFAELPEPSVADGLSARQSPVTPDPGSDNYNFYPNDIADSSEESDSEPVQVGQVLITESGSSPKKHTVQGNNHNPVKPDPEIFQAMARELEGRWIGPMPIDQFFGDFLSLDYINVERPEQSKNWMATFKGMKRHTLEKDMYPDIQALVVASQALSNLKIVNTSQHPDSQNYVNMKNKPDLAVYPESMIEEDGITQFDLVTLAFEIKLALDPFSDSGDATGKYAFEPDAEERTLCRGQLATYARIVLSRQHRTHFFMVFMSDPIARFIRFDRDGAIVSACFDYREEGHFLCEFLWRLSNVSEEMKGSDPTVTPATPDETELVKEKLAKWRPKENKERKVYKLLIQEEEASPTDAQGTGEEPSGAPVLPTQIRQVMEVLVWAPLAEPQCVVGRATRALPAYDPSSKEIVFVKDSWRATEAKIPKEPVILKAINAAGITAGVPVYKCGDDLEGRWQTTATTGYKDESWNIGGKPGNSAKKHIRFVTDKVGLPIEDFESSKQFLDVVYQAFLAHKAVYTKCQILHRDVSLHNMLVTEEGKAFLNDWDMAVYVHEIRSGARQTARSGSWLYTSAYLLSRPWKFHTLQDDIESFYWVILYVILRYMKHNYLSSIEEDINYIFKEYKGNDVDKITGGNGKIAQLQGDVFAYHSFAIINNKALTKFCRGAEKMFLIHHQLLVNTRANVRETSRKPPAGQELEFYEAVLSHLQSTQSPLVSHAGLEELFVKALGSSRWPANDASYDWLKEAMRKSSGKRKAEEQSEVEDNISQAPAKDEAARKKRSKMSSSKTRIAPINLAPGLPEASGSRRSSARVANQNSKPNYVESD
ncbi:hypothetical protein CPC08DRAFT_672124 [Agrocybe pediades]|nr:hypothetical protein CPC08DRAFT_672124 [Agrocybe pediades]